MAFICDNVPIPEKSISSGKNVGYFLSKTILEKFCEQF